MVEPQRPRTAKRPAAPSDPDLRQSARPPISVGGTPRRVLVVGEGATAVMAAMQLCHAGLTVHLMSRCEPRRWQLPLDGLGLNAVEPTAAGISESSACHAEETLQAGGELADPTAVRAMVTAAPQLVAHLVDLGVPFDRSADGGLLRRRLLGSRHARAVTAGGGTAQIITGVIDDHLRRLEGEHASAEETNGPRARLRRATGWELWDLMLDDEGHCVGAVGLESTTMRLRAFPAEAVVLATGAAAHFLGTPGTAGADQALAVAYRSGAALANPELVSIVSAALPTADGVALPVDALRCLGARLLWGDPDHEHAEHRDEALEQLSAEGGSRAGEWGVARALSEVERQRQAYLDLRTLPLAELGRPQGHLLDAIEQRLGLDVRHELVPTEPVARDMVGGLWVDLACDATSEVAVGSARNHSTALPGLYAVGGACHAYHGGARLAGNTLLAGLYGATLVGPAVASYCEGRRALGAAATADADRAVTAAERELARYFDRPAGAGSTAGLHRELARTARKALGMRRSRRELEGLLETLDHLEEGAKTLRPACPREQPSGDLIALRHLECALTVAGIAARCALEREESRPGHHRTDVPDAHPHHAGPTLVRRGEGGSIEHLTAITYRVLGEEVRFESVAAPERQEAARCRGRHDAESLRSDGDDGRSTERRQARKRPEDRRRRATAAAASKQLRTVHLRIRRQVAFDRPETRRFEDFAVRPEPGWTVADALERINEELRDADGHAVEPIGWQGSCRTGTCGSCTLLVDGAARRACATLLSEAAHRRRTIVLEPLSAYPVVRDLLVDRQRLAEDLLCLDAWPDAPPKTSATGAPAGEEPSHQRERLALSGCNHCGACIETCPEARAGRPFVGAAVLNRVRLLDLHPSESPSRAHRIEAILGRGGIVGCAQAGNCVEVCPNEIPLDESLAALNRVALRHLLRRPR